KRGGSEGFRLPPVLLLYPECLKAVYRCLLHGPVCRCPGCLDDPQGCRLELEHQRAALGQDLEGLDTDQGFGAGLSQPKQCLHRWHALLLLDQSEKDSSGRLLLKEGPGGEEDDRSSRAGCLVSKLNQGLDSVLPYQRIQAAELVDVVPGRKYRGKGVRV